MLHYFARHFYAPTLLSPVLTANQTIDIYLINDSLPVFDSDEVALDPRPTTLHIRHGMLGAPVTLKLVMYEWQSLKPRKTWTIRLTQAVMYLVDYYHSF